MRAAAMVFFQRVKVEVCGLGRPSKAARRNRSLVFPAALRIHKTESGRTGIQVMLHWISVHAYDSNHPRITAQPVERWLGGRDGKYVPYIGGVEARRWVQSMWPALELGACPEKRALQIDVINEPYEADFELTCHYSELPDLAPWIVQRAVAWDIKPPKVIGPPPVPLRDPVHGRNPAEASYEWTLKGSETYHDY